MARNRTRAGETEVTILARVLGNGLGRLPHRLARHILSAGFSDRDKARMHDLAARNQAATLTAAEKNELAAYVRAGSLLSILKSKARRVVNLKSDKRTSA